MTTKTLTITEKAYAILSSHKRKDESFSKEILRLLNPPTTISDLAGSWSTMTSKEADRLKTKIHLEREESLRHSRERVS